MRYCRAEAPVLDSWTALAQFWPMVLVQWCLDVSAILTGLVIWDRWFRRR